MYLMYLRLFQDFKAPEKPFLRMNYTDAITYLRDHQICKDDGSFYEFGEVSWK
jgi:asparaginyl-tRNA synthetase